MVVWRWHENKKALYYKMINIFFFYIYVLGIVFVSHLDGSNIYIYIYYSCFVCDESVLFLPSYVHKYLCCTWCPFFWLLFNADVVIVTSSWPFPPFFLMSFCQTSKFLKLAASEYRNTNIFEIKKNGFFQLTCLTSTLK